MVINRTLLWSPLPPYVSYAATYIFAADLALCPRAVRTIGGGAGLIAADASDGPRSHRSVGGAS